MINWKVRFRNPQFLFQLFLSVAAPVGLYYGLSGEDITTWGKLFEVVLNALSNPFVLFTILVSFYNNVVDPTTKGFGDSRQALEYDKPKE